MKNQNIQELHESEIVQNLAPLVDAYVCDAFAASHRNSPTLSGFGKALPVLCWRVDGQGGQGTQDGGRIATQTLHRHSWVV